MSKVIRERVLSKKVQLSVKPRKTRRTNRTLKSPQRVAIKPRPKQ
jgi:hypothetical protein